MSDFQAQMDQGGSQNTGTAAYIPERHFRGVVAGVGETIVTGNLVSFYKSGSTMDGVQVFKTGTGGTDFVCGVAQHNATAGQPLLIQTKGIGAVAIKTHGSGVAVGEGLIAGGTAGAADASDPASVVATVFGYALVADATNDLAASSYILDCWS